MSGFYREKSFVALGVLQPGRQKVGVLRDPFHRSQEVHHKGVGGIASWASPGSCVFDTAFVDLLSAPIPIYAANVRSNHSFIFHHLKVKSPIAPSIIIDPLTGRTAFESFSVWRGCANFNFHKFWFRIFNARFSSLLGTKRFL